MPIAAFSPELTTARATRHAGAAEIQFASWLGATILNVTTIRGEATGWKDIERGLDIVREGQPGYYTGVTGPILLERCGVRRIGTSGTCVACDGRIQDDDAR